MKRRFIILGTIVVGTLISTFCMAKTLREVDNDIINQISALHDETISLRNQQMFGAQCGQFLDSSASKIEDSIPRYPSSFLDYDGSIAAFRVKSAINELTGAKFYFHRALTEATDCINKENFQTTFDKFNPALYTLINIYQN